jgi:hypothetical protein
MHARLSKDASYSTYCACFPCYNMNVVSKAEELDHHIQKVDKTNGDGYILLTALKKLVGLQHTRAMLHHQAFATY